MGRDGEVVVLLSEAMNKTLAKRRRCDQNAEKRKFPGTSLDMPHSARFLGLLHFCI